MKQRMYSRITSWVSVLGLVMLSGGLLTTVTAYTPVAAASQVSNNATCDKTSTFLTFNTWWHGLNMNSDCTIAAPGAGSSGLSAFIWTIVLNVIDDLLQLVGYLSVGFLIYGGFKYITAAGSSDGVAKAKKTITNAIVGLIISIFAVAIVNLIAGAL